MSMSDDRELFARVVLSKVKVAAQAYVSMEFLHSTLDMAWAADKVAQTMTLDLHAYVLTDHLPPERIEQVVQWQGPTTWWDAFKDQHRGRWWLRVAKILRIRPPQWTTREQVVVVHLNRYRMYPQAKVTMPPDTFGSPVLGYSYDTSVEPRDA